MRGLSKAWCWRSSSSDEFVPLDNLQYRTGQGFAFSGLWSGGIGRGMFKYNYLFVFG